MVLTDRGYGTHPSVLQRFHLIKLASGACRTRRCERALCLVQPARQVELAKGHENRSRLCHTRHDRERGDRTSSGEVEADKLAGPAHALLSE